MRDPIFLKNMTVGYVTPGGIGTDRSCGQTQLAAAVTSSEASTTRLRPRALAS